MHNKLYFGLSVFIAAVLYFSFLPGQTVASNNCLPLYNGGVTSKQYCQYPTPNPAANTGSTTTGQTITQTTNGQKIYPATKAKSTPDTGPATWSLLMLFFLGGTGLLLINKAKT